MEQFDRQPLFTLELQKLQCLFSDGKLIVEKGIARHKVSRIKISHTLFLAMVHLQVDEKFSKTVLLVIRIVDTGYAHTRFFAQVKISNGNQFAVVMNIDLERVINCCMRLAI